jgi:hypothetical protein
MADERENLSASAEEWNRKRVNPGEQPADAVPLATWYVRGLIGVASMVLRFLRGGQQMPESARTELNKVLYDLIEELDRAK